MRLTGSGHKDVAAGRELHGRSIPPVPEQAAAGSGGNCVAAILWPVAGGVGGMATHPPNALWVLVSI
ncbi:hypothetical protein TUM12370_33910 [Salmonella enterica subsp. enterica serovar Choleraesuis]|nr:hypothetical protein TUM12370_33910 [Salmonella enterica subsp. enterica serovar Choleraesuis]